ncbi:hypothetical protein [Paenibacillus elgii]|uniref:hypothetical protein n=1 Tax=Paenibacillus elgii TaxID=189691 RepID=UPI000FDA6EEF|nr:hypothetical protein [Paenibacillus elgii]NEN86139.1 hypothetical protein [Paenibacillus elgii]
MTLSMTNGFKKVTLWSLVVCIFLAMFSTVASAAPSQNNSLTVSGYVEYLTEKQKTDPGATEVLEKFKALSSYDQEKFLKVLQSSEIGKVLELKNQTVMIEGVPVETKATLVSDLPNTLNAQWESTVLGVSITTFYLTLTYRFDLANGGRVTKVVDANGAHRNYNPGVIISESGSASKETSGSEAYARQNWTAKMVPAGGFVEYALIGYLKGDGNAGYAKFEGNTPALNNINKGIWQQIWYNDSTHTLK